MKILFLAWLTVMGVTLTQWQTDMETAQKIAREKDRLILLNFSGSDWCGPCIRLRKEIFDAPAFAGMADSNLVLLNADFPRSKKNQLPKAQQQHNDALADQYNPQGKFPFTLLLTADGKVLRSWEGFPPDAAQFIQQVKSLADANHR
jgi:thioredoxin-related protein